MGKSVTITFLLSIQEDIELKFTDRNRDSGRNIMPVFSACAVLTVESLEPACLFFVEKQYVIFEVLKAMNTIFWDVMPCSLEEVTDLLKGRISCIFRIEE